MDNDAKFQLHPDLADASLEAAADLANKLHALRLYGVHAAALAEDLSYMLEYLRLNFVLTPKK